MATTAFLFMGSAQAALVSFHILGNVTNADSGNNFGLSFGDRINASGTFDDSVLNAGTGPILFSKGSGNTLSVLVGNHSFTQLDDVDYALGYPEITLSAGSITQFDFMVNAGAYGHFRRPEFLPLGFEGADDNSAAVSGNWQADTF